MTQVAGRTRRGIRLPPTSSAVTISPTRESEASSRNPAEMPSTKGGIAAEKTVVVSPRPIEPPAIWNM